MLRKRFPIASATGLFLIVAAATTTHAQFPETREQLWPGATYDSSIPTFESVLGHAPGEDIVSHAEIMSYFRALAQAAPERMKLETYAESWEGRELLYAVIGTPERIKALSSIKEQIALLADPRKTDPKAASTLIEQLPATVWLSYGVHGNEISSPDAAMFTAYHLLAAQGDATVDKILANTLIFIDPTQNPDGRDRFVHNFRQSRGIEPDETRLAAERDEPWPGGRTNHYLFDLNRDWFILSQPETRGRVEVLQQWLPQVFVDLHEMGSDSTYYFAPEAVPYNPHLAADQRSSLELVGRNNAKWFDQFGFDYFTREVYDAFYPGYGASWPSYFGSVAMTYEMASARGLLVRRSDGDLLSFRDGVQRHFVTSISTAEMAADNREKLLRDFYAYRQSAVAEGASEPGRSLIVSGRAGDGKGTGDASLADKLAGLLVTQGVEVSRAREAFKACGNDYAAGAYVIDLAQPAKRLLRTLLDDEVPMEEDFLVEQERRRARGLPDQIYDVTAWSLAMLFNLDLNRCDDPLLADQKTRDSFEPAGDSWVVPGTVDRSDARVAYLVPWGSVAAARLLAGALRQGLEALSPDLPFSQNGREYPGGTLVFKVDDNPKDLAQRLAELAAETGANVTATDSSWVDSGVNFGSRNTVRVTPPRIALVWDAPTSSNSAGNNRFVIERQLGYPVSAIRADSLSRADLDEFDVLILPDTFGSYSGKIAQAASEKIGRFVRGGGTLIALGGATEYVAKEGWLTTARERLAGTPESSPAEDGGPVAGKLITNPDEYRDAIQAVKAWPDSVAGVLLEARTDQEHWLNAGLAESVNVTMSGRAIYTPLTLDAGFNALYYPAADQLLASGYLWQQNRDQLAFKPFVMVQQTGEGLVIAFTSDPNVRAMHDGLLPLFASAIFRGSAHTR